MGSWTDATDLRRAAGRAVLRPEHLEQRLVRELLPAQGPLAVWVEHVWLLAWSAPVPPASTAIIPHPAVNLTLEGGPAGEVRHGHALPAALLHGVPDGRFAPGLPAPGWVVGLHLRPGAVRDLTGTPAHVWTGQVVPWAQAWPGWDLGPVWQAGDPHGRAEALRELATRTLGDREPSSDGKRAREVELLVRTDRSLASVKDLAGRVSVSERQLQRLCRDHLGVTPLWLLRRARVLDAHELLSSTDLDLADIAAQLGWYDQSHLTRDYTAVTGTPPARVRRTLARDRAGDG